MKGHRIVLAELGLVPYEGKVVRNEGLFDAPWTRARRAEHLIARLGFVRALFRKAGHERVRLYRGMSSRETVRPSVNRSLVSATFSLAVARSHFDAAGTGSHGTLLRQMVPVDRLVMTYHETAAMNDPFLEAEAALLWEENLLF